MVIHLERASYRPATASERPSSPQRNALPGSELPPAGTLGPRVELRLRHGLADVIFRPRRAEGAAVNRRTLQTSFAASCHPMRVQPCDPLRATRCLLLQEEFV